MKYIRTKDNRIIDTTKYYIENSNLFKNGAYQEYKKELANAYKQADTIEELCDEFVLIHTEYDNSKDIFEARSSGTWLQHRGDNYYSFGLEQVRSGKMNIKGSTLYGAIWTEWGLKYVAKMNDKGELELL